jgi:hypothetical protein
MLLSLQPNDRGVGQGCPILHFLKESAVRSMSIMTRKTTRSYKSPGEIPGARCGEAELENVKKVERGDTAPRSFLKRQKDEI